MKIVEVKYIEEYILECRFDDGKVVIANFKTFLEQAKNPMTTQFRDKKLFAQVKLRNGHLQWGDWQMDIPSWSVYNGEF